MSGATFLVSPSVPLIRDYIFREWGRDSFLYGAATAVAVFLAIAIAWYVRYPFRTASGAAVLLGIGALYGYLIFDLKSGAPEEATHYILFGILGMLLYRAYAHRVRDVSIYGVALLTGAIVGVLDEAIQWAIPGRYFDTRDIWFNITGCALVLIAIAFGIRPKIISGWPDAIGVRRICLAGAGLAIVLGACHLNTPPAVLAYSERIPALAFLADQDDAMIEYGHLHGDPRLGSFKSRLSLDELQQANRERGESGARIIDQYLEREDFRGFIREYPAIKDPYLHEAWVHFRSRDINLSRARDPKLHDVAGENFTFAYHEHQILKIFFADLYTASSYSWSVEQEAEVRDKVVPGLTRQSKVSQHLITTYTPWEAAGFFALLVSALLLGAYAAGRSHNKREVIDR